MKNKNHLAIIIALSIFPLCAQAMDDDEYSALQDTWYRATQSVWPDKDLEPKWYQSVEVLPAPISEFEIIRNLRLDNFKHKWTIPTTGFFSSEDDLVSLSFSDDSGERRIMRRGDAYALMYAENYELGEKRELLQWLERKRLNTSTGEWGRFLEVWHPNISDSSGPWHPDVRSEWRAVGQRIFEQENKKLNNATGEFNGVTWTAALSPNTNVPKHPEVYRKWKEIGERKHKDEEERRKAVEESRRRQLEYEEEGKKPEVQLKRQQEAAERVRQAQARKKAREAEEAKKVLEAQKALEAKKALEATKKREGEEEEKRKRERATINSSRAEEEKRHRLAAAEEASRREAAARDARYEAARRQQEENRRREQQRWQDWKRTGTWS